MKRGESFRTKKRHNPPPPPKKTQNATTPPKKKTPMHCGQELTTACCQTCYKLRESYVCRWTDLLQFVYRFLVICVLLRGEMESPFLCGQRWRTYLVNMTITTAPVVHIILQKSLNVAGKGPEEKINESDQSSRVHISAQSSCELASSLGCFHCAAFFY